MAEEQNPTQNDATEQDATLSDEQLEVAAGGGDHEKWINIESVSSPIFRSTATTDATDDPEIKTRN